MLSIGCLRGTYMQIEQKSREVINYKSNFGRLQKSTNMIDFRIHTEALFGFSAKATEALFYTNPSTSVELSLVNNSTAIS